MVTFSRGFDIHGRSGPGLRSGKCQVLALLQAYSCERRPARPTRQFADKNRERQKQESREHSANDYFSGRALMMTFPELAADALEKFIASYMRRRFGSTQTRFVELVPAAARIALECIGNSDALYHNVEHTLLVTLAAHDILRGRALYPPLRADEYAHIITACLAHDIGYVRGVLKADDADGFVIDT